MAAKRPPPAPPTWRSRVMRACLVPGLGETGSWWMRSDDARRGSRLLRKRSIGDSTWRQSQEEQDAIANRWRVKAGYPRPGDNIGVTVANKV